jgi:hypothetical protein
MNEGTAIAAEPQATESQQLAATVEENTILVKVGTHKMGITRKVKQKTRESYAASTSTDPGMLKASKDLVDSPEYDAIVTRDGEFYRAVMDRVLPSHFMKGIYRLPLTLLDWFEEFYAAYELERTELVEAFIDVYEERKAEAEEKLGENYDAAEYPSVAQVRASFYLEKDYIVRATPGKLEKINPALYGKQREKLQKAMEDSAQEIQLFVRRTLLELVEHLQERLTPGPDGKKKALHEKRVTDLQEYLELLSSLNVTNDAELEQLGNKLKAVMAGTDRDLLRDNKRVRGEVTKGLASAKRQLDDMVKDGPRRRFRLKD